MKWIGCVFAGALLLFVSGEALAETCSEIDADAKRLLASPAQRSDFTALQHLAKRASENPGCDGEYVFRLARDLVLVALHDIGEKAAAESRKLLSALADARDRDFLEMNWALDELDKTAGQAAA